MDVIRFEINKILFRKFSLVLLFATIILFPAFVKTVSYLSAVKDNIPEGLFIENVAFSIIAYIQMYFFLPVWILVLVGVELSNGHVNRVVFSRSRKFYFLSKLSYCGIVTLLFSFLGIVALIISVYTSPYSNLEIDPFFGGLFLAQMSLSTLLFSILLLCLVFAVRSPIKSFIVYFLWTFSEGILFSFFKGVYRIDLKWLPFHLVKTLYARNGVIQLDNYYNPFVDDFQSLVLPFGFVFLATLLTYRLFTKSNLPALSD